MTWPYSGIFPPETHWPAMKAPEKTPHWLILRSKLVALMRQTHQLQETTHGLWCHMLNCIWIHFKSGRIILNSCQIKSKVLLSCSVWCMFYKKVGLYPVACSMKLLHYWERGNYLGLFIPFPGTQIMPCTGLENRVNADTLMGSFYSLRRNLPSGNPTFHINDKWHTNIPRHGWSLMQIPLKSIW